MSEIKQATFDMFIEYSAKAVQSQSLAERWLVEELTGRNYDEMTFTEVSKIISDFQSTKDVEIDVNRAYEFEYDGHIFKFIDQPAKFREVLQSEMKRNMAKGFKFAISTCYEMDGKPITEQLENLSSNHAAILISNLSSFFR